MRYEQMVKTVGGKVLTNFEKKVTKDSFNERRFREQIDDASKIVEQMPYVTLAFRENGILSEKESPIRLLNTFQPNLWAQDIASEDGKLGLMSIHTTKERAESSAEYVLRNYKTIHEILRDKGKTIYDFIDSYRYITMIEGAYYTLLSGAEIDESSARRVKSALMKRLIKSDINFRDITRITGVDFKDNLGLSQFADEIELTDLLKEVTANDPYFARREGIIGQFKTINSRESFRKPERMTDKMAISIIETLMKKFPAAADRVIAQRNDLFTRV